MHESWEHYDSCQYRDANGGLFTADQILRRNERNYLSATSTRQNPNGARSGYECPEERDYYPYWHPNGGWKDVAVLTTDSAQTCDYYKSESFNVKPKHICFEYYKGTTIQKHWSKWNNQVHCDKAGGKWTEVYNYLEKRPDLVTQELCEANINHKWAIPFDSSNINSKECLALLSVPGKKSFFLFVKILIYISLIISMFYRLQGITMDKTKSFGKYS